MTNRNVLISGASIAGPALAYWLYQRGFAPTVVERAPAPRPGGQTVDLRGAGRTVVDRMGLMSRVREVSVEQRGFAIVDANGRIKAEVPEDAFGGEGIISEIEILRGDLGQIFYEASLPTTEYLFDDTITGIQQADDGVLVTFEKAAPRKFAFVFGADGLHSAVRRLAFGPESDYVHPLNCYTAWFTSKADVDLGGWYLMYNAPGGLVVSERPGRLPGEHKAGLSFRSQPIEYDRRDVAAQKRMLAERFAGVGWRAPRLLAAMYEASDFGFDSMGQVKMDSWSRGRVALLGDAACCPSPLTGLGTSLALVGAYVLAGELAAARGDCRHAFARYEEIMRPYVTTGQQLPPGGIGGYAPDSAFAIRSRTLSMRMMTRWPMRALIAKQFTRAESIDLPDYDSVSAMR
ncbi:MAG TPA: FAD-dependent monooxygenase [Pseudonocardiaceae bacterium]|jgi:2-polyprenyl-6-methoxyphenol hydroxylase-like FAD-dependent oxidoreductase|nr:FAD-dependent monooxygenase [Pseudonocardiaceae bacterium]